MSAATALALFAVLAVPILVLGMRSLNGLGPVRKWVAIIVRLLVLACFILIIGGVRFQRMHKDVEVMVVRDISVSTRQVRSFPGQSLQASVDEYLKKLSDSKDKRASDRIGMISFNENALIDAVPANKLVFDTGAIKEGGNGTDAAAALQLALATMSKDAMHRILLVWDGNSTSGDLDAALTAARAAKIPIDVMPLEYDVSNEVLVDRFVAPTWKRENEPFTMDVILRSTNIAPVTGTLSVVHGTELMDLDPQASGKQEARRVTLKPGLNVERIYVSPLETSGPHQFQARFEPDNLMGATTKPSNAGTAVVQSGDTLTQNNLASAFTFVRGKGKVLFIDNLPTGEGNILLNSLKRDGITVDEARRKVDQFPTSLVELQAYDAVVLANVRRGAGGLSDDQEKMLAKYVHDMGGGLVMIGGEEGFGAGSWQGSEVEKILPVDMDIPAQRQIPKGALVLIMHSCEMPNGNFWGEQCAIKAAETLSSRDEIGVISFNWQGGGSQWDFPLQERGDGGKVKSAIKAMALGDMPSFDDSVNVALNGSGGQPGLIQSDARNKHIIVISDGDPAMPNGNLIAQAKQAKISISTVTVYTHTPGTISSAMQEMAKQTGGRPYGPIEQNPNQLPQIFIKEATIVRRSLIQEDKKGFAVRPTPSSADIAKGLQEGVPPVYGFVLTSRKNNPQVEVPLIVGKNGDPLLAYWQAGLGRAVAYTSDASTRWDAQWKAAPIYDKFWAQVVRSVARPPMSADFEVTTKQEGEKGKIVVEALNRDSRFLNFLSVQATVVGPDASKQPQSVRLVQTGPGTYEAEFDAKDPGAYVGVVSYQGGQGGSQQGMTLSGMVVNTSPELRELRSNESLLHQIKERTDGRWIKPFDPSSADLFSRAGLQQGASPMPIWDLLLPFLLTLILIDVATRRIAWDWNSTKRLLAGARDYVQSYTTTRKVETTSTIDAFKQIKERASETGKPETPVQDRPDPRAKFESKQKIEGDITSVLGGATDKPLPPPPKKAEPKGLQGEGSSMSGLMAAKKRAQEKIREKEKEG
jgi:uncharacterized membrane protein